jgi:hypothetical protein
VEGLDFMAHPLYIHTSTLLSPERKECHWISAVFLYIHEKIGLDVLKILSWCNTWTRDKINSYPCNRPCRPIGL